MTATAWQTDNHASLHTRGRVCLAHRDQGPVAVLLVATAEDGATLTRALAGQPLAVDHVPDPADALLVLGRTCPDAVVPAPTHGRLRPSEFLQVLRSHEPDIPVVVGVDEHDDAASPTASPTAVPAAGLGAAVLAHPFDPDRLLTLLGSLVATQRHLTPRPLVLDLGRLRLDGAAPRLWLDGSVIKLPMREYLVLRYRAERRDTVATRNELVTALWGRHDSGTSKSLTVHIRRIRRRLGDDAAAPRWIEAVRGLGYRFSVPAHPIDPLPVDDRR